MASGRGVDGAGALRLWLAGMVVVVSLLALPAAAWAQDSTGTSLNATPSPAGTGQTVTLTATVSDTTAPGSTPTGSVSIDDGGNPIAGCQNMTLSSGSVSCQTTFATPGDHLLTATYSPDQTTFDGSSDQQTEDIQDATVTGLVTNPSPGITGEAVALSATVADASNPGTTPTGSVSIDDGGNPISGCQNLTLSSGGANCDPTFTTPGDHTLTATYTPDATTLFAGSNSTPATETVNDPTSTSLGAVPSPATTNQAVTLTATVGDTANGAMTPTGSVEFFNAGTPIPGCESVALVSGSATCPDSFTAASSPEALSATYTPNSGANFIGTSTTALLTVARDATATALATTNNSPTAGQSVTYTATVTPDDTGPTLPAGTVTFKDGGTPISSCASQPLTAGVSSSTATCTLTFKLAGPHAITAVYAGDPNFAGSGPSNTQNVVVATAPSTTSLSANPASAVTNQQVALTAAVSGGDGTATGTVQFVNGATPISGCESVPLDGSGDATCPTSFAASTSPENVTAMYSPDGASGYASSLDNTTVSVTKDTTAVALAAPSTSAAGDQVTYVVTVAPTHSGSVSPTGSVSFTDNGSPAACSSPPALSSGAASCTVTYTTPGPHTVTATYAGDSNFSGNTSNRQTVNVTTGATSTVLSATDNSPSAGENVTYTATVTPLFSGGPALSGSVNFTDNGTQICTTQQLSGSTATCEVSYATTGRHTVTANYSGDTNYSPSTSEPQVVVVGGAPSTTTLTANPSTLATNQATTLTAAVTGTVGVPTGTVRFFDTSGAPIPGCSDVPLASGSATCKTAFAAAASPESLTAVYAPANSSSYGGSSDTLSLDIAKDGTTTTLPAPSSPVTAGDPVTYTATVKPADSGPFAPTGSVSFFDNGSPAACAGPTTLSSGAATCVITYTSAGSHTVTASYAGDGNFSGSQPPTAQNVTVNPAVSTTTLTANHTSPVTNEPVTLTASVSGGDGIPAGSIAFKDGTTTLPGCGSTSLDASGIAKCTTTFGAGNHSLTATYAPAGTGYDPSSGAYPLTVGKASDSVALTTSSASVVAGKNVTFTATVTPGQSGPIEPSGTVKFLDGATAIGTCAKQPLTQGASNSTATCAVSYSDTGSHTIVAEYDGDSNFSLPTGAAAFSNPRSINVVAPPVTATTLRAANITTTTALLKGVISTSGAAVGWQFQYGTSFPNQATTFKNITAGHGNVNVSASVSHLIPATTYHFELVAISGQPNFGRELAFTTKPLGSLLLAFSSLRAVSGSIGLPMHCTSHLPCTGSVGVRTAAGSACAQAAYHVRGGQSRTIAAHMSAACRTLARKHGNRLRVIVTSRPTSHQYAMSKTVTLVLR